MKDDVKAKVVEIIAAELSVDESKITDESSLQDDLGADSLDGINIGLAIEDAFKIKVEDEVLQEFRTVKDIVGALEKILSEEGGSKAEG